MENKVQLGEEQIQAIEAIKKFIESSSETAFSLIGSAGTGKTTIMKELIKWLRPRKKYCLCAPTHKAKLVLERLTGDYNTQTLHKLLALSPNIEILELDFRDLQFIVGKSEVNIPYKGVVICDESSMINDELFKLLNEKCKSMECKILFVGDKAQLRPVNSKDTSLVFNVKDRFELTKIYRQSDSSALMPIFQILRNNIITHFESEEGKEGSLVCTEDATDFIRYALPKFRKAMSNRDILYTKIIAYTNNRVAGYNNCMKKALFRDDKEYHPLEFLTGYENLEFNGTKFFNSMDYIVTDEPKKMDVYIPEFMKLPGYELNLYDTTSDIISPIFILSKEISSDYFHALAAKIEDIRLAALEQRSRIAANKLWGIYYSIIGSFTTPVDLCFNNRVIRKKSFDYGYACSAHKSQGSTFQEIFVDIKNINSCRDDDERRQLQYVALSRTRTNAYILQQWI